jgi:hypothetical protein
MRWVLSNLYVSWLLVLCLLRIFNAVHLDWVVRGNNCYLVFCFVDVTWRPWHLFVLLMTSVDFLINCTEMQTGVYGGGIQMKNQNIRLVLFIG